MSHSEDPPIDYVNDTTIQRAVQQGSWGDHKVQMHLAAHCEGTPPMTGHPGMGLFFTTLNYVPTSQLLFYFDALKVSKGL